MFKKNLDQGQAGDNVGVLLRGIERDDIERGQVLAKPGTITPHTEFDAEVYILTKEEAWIHRLPSRPRRGSRRVLGRDARRRLRRRLVEEFAARSGRDVRNLRVRHSRCARGGDAIDPIRGGSVRLGRGASVGLDAPRLRSVRGRLRSPTSSVTPCQLNLAAPTFSGPTATVKRSRPRFRRSRLLLCASTARRSGHPAPPLHCALHRRVHGQPACGIDLGFKVDIDIADHEFGEWSPDPINLTEDTLATIDLPTCEHWTGQMNRARAATS